VIRAAAGSLCSDEGTPLADTASGDKWDRRFLGLAEFVSGWSKDPSTQVGAAIVDDKRRVVSIGYNGFPRGVGDDPERYADRDLKYKMVVHAEINAILFAGRSVEGCDLYTHPFCPCSRCAVQVIQAGIKRCVAPPLPDRLKERWGVDTALSAQMFREAGVELVLLAGNRPASL
jgi:dCMP deaminase